MRERPEYLQLVSVSNPLDDTFDWDKDNLNWYGLTAGEGSGIPGIPQPTNSDSIDRTDFFFGATTPTGGGVESGSVNPPGIKFNEKDIFYMTFGSNVFLSDLYLQGIRIQSIPDTLGILDSEGNNTTSLFLVNTAPIPEPSTTMLFGLGALGFAGIARRKMKKK